MRSLFVLKYFRCARQAFCNRSAAIRRNSCDCFSCVFRMSFGSSSLPACTLKVFCALAAMRRSRAVRGGPLLDERSGGPFGLPKLSAGTALRPLAAATSPITINGGGLGGGAAATGTASGSSKIIGGHASPVSLLELKPALEPRLPTDGEASCCCDGGSVGR